jgi:hypothetical protein
MSETHRSDPEYLGRLRAVSSALSLVLLVAIFFSNDRAMAWAVVYLANEIGWSAMLVILWLGNRQ